MITDTACPFRTAYGPKLKVQLTTGKIGAKQSFKNDCDINVILARYMKTGVLPDTKARAEFMDVPQITYLEAMNIIQLGDKAFFELPSEQRDFFQNNPANFLAFTQEESNLEEMRKMGLARPQTSEVKVTASEPPVGPV